ncbi:MAG TPA: prephenate dehydratase domain-containing protein [Candidatus Saccharimonadales bacterium]
MNVAIQGAQASFHHQAAASWFGQAVSIIECDSFGDVFGTLNRHEAAQAVIAVENSLYGSINEVLDLVEAHGYPIVGEVYLPIEQQLITLPNVSLSQITRVYSHPVALAQCQHFLDTHLPNAERVEYHDTAASVELIKSLGNPAYAAISGRMSAELHGLPILSENIEDNRANITRFLVLSAGGKKPNDVSKASFVIATDHTPGALARILAGLASHGANLTKLQSRPIIGEPWNYRFYIDIEADASTIEECIDFLKNTAVKTTVLGKYNAASA